MNLRHLSINTAVMVDLTDDEIPQHMLDLFEPHVGTGAGFEVPCYPEYTVVQVFEVAKGTACFFVQNNAALLTTSILPLGPYDAHAWSAACDAYAEFSYQHPDSVYAVPAKSPGRWPWMTTQIHPEVLRMNEDQQTVVCMIHRIVAFLLLKKFSPMYWN